MSATIPELGRTFTLTGYITELQTQGIFNSTDRVQEGDLRFGGVDLYLLKRYANAFLVGYFNVPMERKADNTFYPSLTNVSFLESWLVFYPSDPLHVSIFSKLEVEHSGPHELFPGSVAVLDFNFDPYTSGTITDLNYLQYCFRQGSPAELTRSLATKYMGARKHLLEFALQLSLDAGISWLNYKPKFARNPRNVSQVEELMRDNPKFTKFKIMK